MDFSNKMNKGKNLRKHSISEPIQSSYHGFYQLLSVFISYENIPTQNQEENQGI